VRECCLWHRIPEKEKRPLREVKKCKNVSIMVSFSQVYVWQYDFAEKKCDFKQIKIAEIYCLRVCFFKNCDLKTYKNLRFQILSNDILRF
jgi:hypothetical protein